VSPYKIKEISTYPDGRKSVSLQAEQQLGATIFAVTSVTQKGYRYSCGSGEVVLDPHPPPAMGVLVR
jgi:hypothetical protein